MRRHRGFTLIEVMVAAAIVGMATTALFALFSKSLSNLKRVEDLREYQLAAESVMNAALLLPELPPGGMAEGQLQQLKARWILNVTPWYPVNLDSHPAEAIVKIAAEVIWPGRSGERRVTLEIARPVALTYSKYDLQNAIDTILPN
jgi:prepilin-type N-terminal cleavage/methylation domain-containing protein